MNTNYEPGDRVRITGNPETLPMPQCLYAGQHGTVEPSGLNTPCGCVMVAPDEALSGLDSRKGIPFKVEEIEHITYFDQGFIASR